MVTKEGSLINSFEVKRPGTRVIFINDKIYTNFKSDEEYMLVDPITGELVNELPPDNIIPLHACISTNNLDICRSKTILTSFSHGSDNFYFFDGNDKTPRLPIISVDEEAYCFMKIKE